MKIKGATLKGIKRCIEVDIIRFNTLGIKQIILSKLLEWITPEYIDITDAKDLLYKVFESYNLSILEKDCIKKYIMLARGW